MKNCNCKNSIVFRISELIAIMTLITVSFGLPGLGASRSTKAGKQADTPIVAKCKADLAKRLKLRASNIRVIEVNPTTWPDAALGMPEMGKMYAQVITPGSRVTLEANSTRYLYTTSTKSIRYGGPISIWSFSMLYAKPVKDEPNLNADLYQCSMLGTNAVRILSGVTDFYPQAKGAVIATRRTSRSGFELVIVNAARPNKSIAPYAAFDIGAAALNDTQNKWAALVRPGIGAEWKVVIGPNAEHRANAQFLPLPDGVKPEQIAWAGDKLMILRKNSDRPVCFEITPSAAKPEWKQVAVYTFPGLPDYMLNKSETLEISEVTVDGKSGVEVARVWFTGDRNVKARINDVTLRGYDFLAGRYAFVWGEKNSAPVAYTVDIATGEVIPASSGIGGDIKPFLFPPLRSPIVPGR